MSPRLKYLRTAVADGLQWLMTDGPIAGRPVYIDTPRGSDWTYVTELPRGQSFMIYRPTGAVYANESIDGDRDVPIWSPE
jgi:hypothetical protein